MEGFIVSGEDPTLGQRGGLKSYGEERERENPKKVTKFQRLNWFYKRTWR